MILKFQFAPKFLPKIGEMKMENKKEKYDIFHCKCAQ